MEFLDYFSNVFLPYNFLVLVIGTISGVMLGATPGVSPTMSVALLVPFTFKMSPEIGLILLGSVYVGSVAGGAISAILINIPGSPANIATLLDGYPLAKSNRAAEALNYCFISSFIGGVIGVFILIFFTPMLADFSLRFGPSELFWVAILGITVIASVGSRNPIKGLMSGFLGLWISTIGYNPTLGVKRFIFTDYLSGGIHIIAALIGLFAIPEVINILSSKETKVSFNKIEKTNIWVSFVNNVKKIKALVIGVITGVIVGVIPGAGGQIAGLVAYDQTKKFNKKPENFGKGEIEGIVSAESANNAMVGPSLIPLLTLGIPGSPTAAVLLGGLLIHGLFPGSELFTDYRETTWTFIDALLVSQVIMLIFGLFISRYSYFIISIPQYFMGLGVFILAVFGVYNIQTNFDDVVVMVFLGIGMFFIGKYGFSAASMVLGIILGPIVENNFLQGQIIASSSDGGLFSYFFTGTLNIAIIAIVIFSIVYSIYVEGRERKKRKTINFSRHISKENIISLIIAFVLLFYGLYYDKPDAFLVPNLVAVVIILFALVSIFQKKPKEAVRFGFDFKRLVVILSSILVYTFTVDIIGLFFTSLVFFILLGIFYMPRDNIILLKAVSKVVTIGGIFIFALYVLFILVLKTSIPDVLVF